MKIREKVQSLVKEHNIDYVVFEDIQLQQSVGNNVKIFKVLAQVFGIINELLEEINIPNHSILSVQWKSAAGVKGRARKEQKANSIKLASETYNIKPTEDEADAIWIGASYWLYTNKEEGFDWS